MESGVGGARTAAMEGGEGGYEGTSRRDNEMKRGVSWTHERRGEGGAGPAEVDEVKMGVKVSEVIRKGGGGRA